MKDPFRAAFSVVWDGRKPVVLHPAMPQFWSGGRVIGDCPVLRSAGASGAWNVRADGCQAGYGCR